MRASTFAARVAVVPAHSVETYLAIGWRLTDEPHCSGARMLPPKIPLSQPGENHAQDTSDYRCRR